MSTVIVSQVSAFALVGESLADTGPSNRGIIGMILDLVNRFTRAFNTVAETKIAIEEEGSGDESSGDYDYDEEGSGDEESNGKSLYLGISLMIKKFQVEFLNLWFPLSDQL